MSKPKFTTKAKVICHLSDGAKDTSANATLLSAAPDLYAVVAELEESSCYWSEYDVPIGVVERMRAALAKARGRNEKMPC